MKRSLQLTLAAVLVIASLSLSACSQAEETAEPAPEETAASEPAQEIPAEEAPAEEASSEQAAEEESAAEEATAERSFSEWAGVWNSLDTYLDDPGLADAYATVAERESSTADEILAGFKERYKSEVISLKIDGDILTVYSKVQGAEPVAEDQASETTYAFVGAMTTEAGYTWSRFDAQGESEYPVLLLLDVGEDAPGETMRHFHFRYGKDADELFATEDWFPTMVKSDSTIDLIANDFTLE